MLSFMKLDDFTMQDVSSIVGDDIGINLVKVKVEKGRISGPEVEEEVVPLIKCPHSYVDGFLSEQQETGLYKNSQNAFCVPLDQELIMKGNPTSKELEYFKIRVFNKYGN